MPQQTVMQKIFLRFWAEVLLSLLLCWVVFVKEDWSNNEGLVDMQSLLLSFPQTIARSLGIELLKGSQREGFPFDLSRRPRALL